MLSEKAALFFFGAEKFALKYDVPDDINPYNKMRKDIARRQNLWDWEVLFITLSKKDPCFLQGRVRKICKQDL